MYYSLCILPVIIPGLRAANSGHARHDFVPATSFLLPRQTTGRSKSPRRCDALLLPSKFPPEAVAYNSSLRVGNVDNDGIPPPSPPSSAPAVAAAALVSYSVLAGLYLSGVASGYPAEFDLGPAVARDVAAGLACAVLATVWVKIWTSQVDSDGTGLDPKLCRKIIHTTSAPLFILAWPLFCHLPGGGLAGPSRYFAAVVSALNMLKLWAAGRSGNRSNELARAVSRSGDPKEALGGPLVYAAVLTVVTVVSWTDNLCGIAAILVMAVGDGTADIIGRRYGKVKWPFSDSKSIAGTVAFASLSFVALVGIGRWLKFTGSLPAAVLVNDLFPQTALLCAICAVVELLPFVDDNWTVPIAGFGLAALLLN